MNLRYRVELSQAERDDLKTLISAGKHQARKLKRAQILLAADARVPGIARASAGRGGVGNGCIQPCGCSTDTGSTGRRGKLSQHDRSHKL